MNDKLFKIINGEWKGWYGTLEKINRDKNKVKLSIEDMSSNKPFLISWFNIDDVELLS